MIPAINIEAFQANLSVATTSTASAGETSASSSSCSTAASQRDYEEKVDEVASQNLKNYDENQQGIRLPDDQTFAYDDEGNIYFIVTLANPKAKGGSKESHYIPCNSAMTWFTERMMNFLWQ